MISQQFTKHKVIIGNILSLTVLQGLNYILPLITVPYLVRILGPENYGIIIFASAFIAYFQIIADYGFNMSATRNISINKDNKEKLNEIFSAVMTIKFLLTVLGFISLIIIVLSSVRFRYDYKAYIFAYGMVVGNLLFPIWFFQGIEQMKYITGINTIGKIFSTLLIFVLVKNPSNYMTVIYLNSFTSILIGIISLSIIFRKFKIKFVLSKYEILKHEFKEGWHIFTTSFLTSILTTTGTFILGLFSTKEVVGYYGAIDKIVKALVSMFSPITQAIFPHIAATFKKSFVSGEKEVYKFAKIVMIFVTIMCTVSFVFYNNITSILYGHKYDNYSYILRYMSPWMFLSILNNFIGAQYLIGSGNGKYYSRSFTLCAIITFVLYFTLIKSISFNAIIIGSNVGELVLTLTMIYYIKYKVKKEFV